jgi:hypothetical protein
MFYNLEHLFNGEVLSGFETLCSSGPREWRSFLAVGLKLEEGVVYTVKEDLVVDVLTLSNEAAFLSSFLDIPELFPSFLQG